MRATILTSKNSWIYINRKKFSKKLFKNVDSLKIISNSSQIKYNNNILIILSYTKLINSKDLKKSDLNLVVHESNLPVGKGWTPLFWQILRGQTKIVTTLFEPNLKIDDGKIIMKKIFNYEKDLVYEEIKVRQFNNAVYLINKFITKYEKNKSISYYKPNSKIKSSFYKKRYPKMSKIDLKKNLESQINLLRISDNKSYPCFFYFNGKKFFLKLSKKV